MMVRSMPFITDVATYNAQMAFPVVGGAPAAGPLGARKVGVGFSYDTIGRDPVALAANMTVNIHVRDNYNNTPNVPAIGAGAGVFKELSKIIKFGLRDREPMRRVSRADSSHAGQQGAGFGNGRFKESPVFTVSLIEPNFIFTSTENSTMQTFDVRLMWGDTSEEVEGVAGNPVQFSIIASP